MANRVSASLKVGGVLPSSALAEFIELILEQNLGPDWDEYFDDEADLSVHLADGAEGVTFYAHEVAGGEFEDLQAFCLRQGLTYVLTYDGFGGEWAPGRRIRRPEDRGEGMTCTLDADMGAACISADEITARGFGAVADILAHLDRFNRSETPDFVIDAAPAASTETAP